MTPMVCEVCGAPAEVAWSSAAPGVDFDGSDALFDIQRVNCAAGHWYTNTELIVSMDWS